MENLIGTMYAYWGKQLVPQDSFTNWETHCAQTTDITVLYSEVRNGPWSCVSWSLLSLVSAVFRTGQRPGTPPCPWSLS